MIPKIIHHCWFGKNQLPDDAKKCIASWKKYFPDYEIKEWNEYNYDLNSCHYVREAYQAKKWAFVSDYARFDILYKYGGIYFDTDVEVIKSFDDIIEKGPFIGLESGEFKANEYIHKCVNPLDKPALKCDPAGIDEINIAAGLGLAANAGLEIYKKILDEYHKRHFIMKDGELDTFTVVQFVTNILLNEGIIVRDGIGYSAGIYIYPKDYFCPKDYFTGKVNITDNSRSIHHYSATWLTPTQLKIHEIEIKYMEKYGETEGRKKARKATAVLRIKNQIDNKGIIGAIRFIPNKIFKRHRA